MINVRGIGEQFVPVVRIISDETDSDGIRMIASLRERGADADLWSLDHLDVDHATGALAYRGHDVAAPDFAIPYHPRLSDEMFGKLYSMERHGVPMSNPIAAIETSLDKGLTANLLREAGVPHPETVEVTSPEAAIRAVELLHRDGAPIFFKNPVGTQGIGVAGIIGRRDALDVAKFISANSDLRVRAGGLLLQTDAADAAPLLARTPEDVERAVDLLHRTDRPLRLTVARTGDSIELRSRGEALSVGQLVTGGVEQGTSGERLLVQAGLVLPEGVPLHDTRHFTNAGSYLAGMDRVQETPGELRTGLSSGAVGRIHDGTPEEQDVALRTADALGLSGTAGVDMLAGHVLEVNAAPGQRMQDVVNVDLPGHVADDALARIAARRAAQG